MVSQAEPAKFLRPQRVESSHIDAYGHASNIAYLGWIQDVAWAHSEHLGFGAERYLREKHVFVVRRHQIDYLRPTFAGEMLQLQTWIGSWSAASSVRMTRIVRQSDGVEVTKASTLWAYVSTEDGRPRKIPEHIVRAFAPNAANIAPEGAPRAATNA